MRISAVLLTCLLLVTPRAGRALEAIDMLGRPVPIPAQVGRVACLEVLCYQKMLLLGAADRVRLMVDTAAPWMAVVDPAVARIPRFTGEPSFEDLLADRIDMVFFAYNVGRTAEKLRSLGLAAAVSQPQGRLGSADLFVAESKRSLRLFARILGGDAERQAEAWCRHLDQRLALVRDRLADLPATQRPKVYYLRGPRALDTQGPGSATYAMGELAGAEMVVKDQTWGGKGVVSMEDMVRWDPDVILVGRQYSSDLVLKDERWATIAAVRNGRVFAMPEGVFYWDGGVEIALLLEYLAKLFHPERFADLDMVAEVEDFYARFYRHALNDREARLLLDGRSPDGSRVNPWNN